MENLVINPNFWRNQNVFLTGHTGFKGGWLAIWLTYLGANVYGYSLNPPTDPNFFSQTNLKDKINKSIIGNITDKSFLSKSMNDSKPTIIIHMAAQSLVSKSFIEPLETYMTNVIGTANVIDVAKDIKSVKAILNVTSDKCYENLETLKPYSEKDRLGGKDPYLSSKACAELVALAYKESFLNNSNIKLASVRAGNVIGGGDWAENRLIPDFFRANKSNKTLNIRSPNSIRPWQHVLEPLSGYLLLCEKMVETSDNFSESWNFGPDQLGEKTVLWVVNQLIKLVPNTRWKFIKNQKKFKEANLLKLDITKAKSKLGWKPRWSIEKALDMTVKWYQMSNENVDTMYEYSLEQIKSYQLG